MTHRTGSDSKGPVKRLPRFSVSQVRGPAACLAAAWLVTGWAHAEEKMRESAPTQSKSALNKPPGVADPLLERMMKPGTFNPGRDNSDLSVPPTTRPNPAIDAAMQKRWAQELDKRRSWLLENASRSGSQDKNSVKPSEDRPLFHTGSEDSQNPSSTQRYLKAIESARKPENGSTRFDGSADPDSGLAQDDFRGDRNDTRPLNTARILGSDIDGRSGPGYSAPARSPGLFGVESAPLRTSLDEARRTAVEERNSAFDRLLSGPANPSASPIADTAIAADPRHVPSRARQFESLMAGPQAPPAAAFSAPATPASSPLIGRSQGLIPVDRTRPSSLDRPAPTAIPRTEPVRVRPLPAQIESPRTGY